MTNTIKDERMKEIIRQQAAEFLRRESSRSSLITITGIDFKPRTKTATIYFTVFPESEETAALEFAKRKRSDFRASLKDNTKLPFFPIIDFMIDEGEKNRQRIDALAKETDRNS